VIEAATPTPTPTPIPEIHPTWGAIQTNTPSILTATPAPTLDRSGCPSGSFDTDGLDSEWASVCSRCIALATNTPQVTIPAFVLGTVAPLSTLATAAPTWIPMYTTPTLGGLSIVPTAGVTSTPSAAPFSYTFDLTASSGGWVVNHADGVDVGSWVSGEGWNTVYNGWSVPGYSGAFAVLDLGLDFSTLNVTGVTVHYGSYPVATEPLTIGYCENSCSSYSYISGLPFNTSENEVFVDYAGIGIDYTTLDHFGFRLIGTSGYGYVVPVTSITISGIGVCEWCGSPTSTPEFSPTPAPTSRPPILCDTPLYGDYSTPIVNVDVDTTDLGTDCYTVIPEVDTSGWLFDAGLRIDGVEICFQWKAFPTIQVFGLTIALDLLLIIPLAYLVRRLLTF